jgi:hypothetical protein
MTGLETTVFMLILAWLIVTCAIAAGAYFIGRKSKLIETLMLPTPPQEFQAEPKAYWILSCNDQAALNLWWGPYHTLSEIDTWGAKLREQDKDVRLYYVISSTRPPLVEDFPELDEED